MNFYDLNFYDLLAAFNMYITGGERFCWECFGPDAWYLDFGDAVNIIFDRNNRTIYEVSWYDPSLNNEQDDIVSRSWINPAFLDAYLSECESRSVNPSVLEDDLIAFIKAIVTAEGFDKEFDE